MDRGEGDAQLDEEGLFMNLDGRDEASTSEQQNSQLEEGINEWSNEEDGGPRTMEEEREEEEEEEEQRAESIPRILRVNTVLSHLPPSSSLPRVTERTPLIRPASSFAGLCSTSWNARVGPSPYTAENKPKRRPFQYVGSSSSIRGGGVQQTREREPNSEDAQLYNRYRYYSRLRADVHPSEQALVIPDHVVPPQLFLPYIPGHVPDADGKQASHITIIAIWNTMMGTSLMTMPWAFGQAGFLGGLIIMLGMALLALYTATCLLTLQKTMGMEGASQELSRVCKQLVGGGALGRVLEGLTVTFSVLTLVGAQVVYWVLMSNFLFNTGEVIYDMLQGEIHNDSSNALLCPPNVTEQTGNFVAPDPVGFHHWWQQDLTVPLYLIVPFLFLLNLRDAKIFTYFNSLGAISVLVMYLFVIFKAATWGININFTDPSNTFYDPFFKNTFMCLTGTLSLAYFIHNCIVTIMQGNRHQENNVRDLSIAYTLVALTYIPIGVLFYTSFPLPKYCIVDNFLDNFPPHDVLLAVVRGFLFFQILTVYPLLGFFIRNQLFTYFLGPGHTFYLPRVMFLNALLITFSVLVAIFYPNIGFIIRWVGAISGLAYIFLLPCLTHMLALHTQGRLTYPLAMLHTVIIILGIGNFVAQFFTE
ncbi:hypothetical protein Pcinc_016879 [Petrolisthes cinctipes]|uniref:Amino acid transporter transmembrane domain-containing protein n=1 Tax=Petrolisthes cinctipes TaxID=88211 RepID=A0AAE1FVA8_PETCI|nr:hypothetical protein Pcinc_037390 [Petrolisthes cinctipes]KAK3878493.1 hypothetical protein Pcinc_016879 [Petrolisthes cinctipes]